MGEIKYSIFTHPILKQKVVQVHELVIVTNKTNEARETFMFGSAC